MNFVGCAKPIGIGFNRIAERALLGRKSSPFKFGQEPMRQTKIVRSNVQRLHITPHPWASF